MLHAISSLFSCLSNLSKKPRLVRRRFFAGHNDR
jgi:hypothetical protein